MAAQSENGKYRTVFGNKQQIICVESLSRQCEPKDSQTTSGMQHLCWHTNAGKIPSKENKHAVEYNQQRKQIRGVFADDGRNFGLYVNLPTKGIQNKNWNRTLYAFVVKYAEQVNSEEAKLTIKLFKGHSLSQKSRKECWCPSHLKERTHAMPATNRNNNHCKLFKLTCAVEVEVKKESCISGPAWKYTILLYLWARRINLADQDEVLLQTWWRTYEMWGSSQLQPQVEKTRNPMPDKVCKRLNGLPTVMRWDSFHTETKIQWRSWKCTEQMQPPMPNDPYNFDSEMG